MCGIDLKKSFLGRSKFYEIIDLSDPYFTNGVDTEHMDPTEAEQALHALSLSSWFDSCIDTELTAFSDMSNSDHYVLGRNAPFRWRLGVANTNDGEELVAALFAGATACNLSGNMQGGAIASAFDVCVATLGSLRKDTPGTFGTTKSLRVEFRLPVPLQVPLKIHAKAVKFNIEEGFCMVEATMSDGESNEVYARCHAEMVDMVLRARWKKKKNQKMLRSKI